jgi:diguanylate cyclase (GGDEF)-like protein
MRLPEPRITDFPDISRFGSHLPPVNEAELLRLLRLIAVLIAALMVIFFIVALNTGLLIQAPIIATSAIVFALIGRGYPPLGNTQLASTLAIGLTILVSIMVLLSGEGIRNVAVLAYPGILILASLTVSSMQFLAIAIAICTTAVGLGMLEVHQLRDVAYGPILERRYLLTLLLILAGTAVMARLLAHHWLSTLYRVHWQALIDSLTGLPNRRALYSRVDSFLAEALNAGLKASVITLHVDRIDHINHTFGHALGDSALRKLADELKPLIAPNCLIARHGGNTFVVLLRSPENSDETEAFARQLIAITQREQTVNGVAVRLDGTCGVCSSSSNEAKVLADAPEDATALIEAAFIALDIALKQGGGQVQEFVGKFGDRVRGDFLIESTVRAAIDSGRVDMHYQPFISQPDGRVIAMEALLRLRSPDGQPLSALPAIELAEASGLIHRLGEVILDSVLNDIQRWRKANESLLPVSINFSGLQMSRPGFAENLLKRLVQYGLPGSALILEITETAAISGDVQLAETLETLSKAGVLIALDDFGAGHSSLHRLCEIPADIIKFDRSLIENIGDSERARLFLRKTVELVRVSHPFILFEGIDDLGQAGQIPEMGGHAVQGYWYARPMSADAVPEYLASQQLGDDLQQRPVHPE